MNTTTLVVTVVAVVVVLTALGVVADRYRRRRQLRERFGPEYDRTLATAPNAREAESELKRRLAERDGLSIRPLSPADRDRYSQQWRRVQAEFVDVPGTSLAQADALVTEAMLSSGYPVQDFSKRADLVSVEHPGVVEQYRKAHAIFVTSQSAPIATEQIRQAFVAYRAVFEELMTYGHEGSEPGEAERPSGARL
jgi:hypothetical protein